MHRNLKLYLESSVISMYFQDEALYLKGLTRKFWLEVLPRFDVSISEIVIEEIEATPELDLREALEDLVENFDILEVSKDVVDLSSIYLSHRRIPREDALHIASASIGQIDFLVTWNLRHIYKRGTQEIIREVNTKLGMLTPEIVTPEDFFEEEI